MSGKLRWKRDPSVRRAPYDAEVHRLTDGVTEYAAASSLGPNWFWFSMSSPTMPWVNTCNKPVKTLAAAKAAAEKHVKAALAKLEKEKT